MNLAAKIEIRRWDVTPLLRAIQTTVMTTASIQLPLPDPDISRIIEMAWEDRTPFEAIQRAYGLNEGQVIRLMRREMKSSSFRMWRKRVSARATKHAKLRGYDVGRFRCATQKNR